VIQLLRQGDSHIFKKYSQMKLQMKREALEKINRRANEMSLIPAWILALPWFSERVLAQLEAKLGGFLGARDWEVLYNEYALHCRGVAQPGSAPALGAGGPEFKSRRPDQKYPPYFL
jgi:hypothetical protein